MPGICRTNDRGPILSTSRCDLVCIFVQWSDSIPAVKALNEYVTVATPATQHQSSFQMRHISMRHKTPQDSAWPYTQQRISFLHDKAFYFREKFCRTQPSHADIQRISAGCREGQRSEICRSPITGRHLTTAKQVSRRNEHKSIKFGRPVAEHCK